MKPVKLTHTEASLVLSNWWILDYDGAHQSAHLVPRLMRLDGDTALFEAVKQSGSLDIDSVAACIKVVNKRGRR